MYSSYNKEGPNCYVTRYLCVVLSPVLLRFLSLVAGSSRSVLSFSFAWYSSVMVPYVIPPFVFPHHWGFLSSTFFPVGLHYCPCLYCICLVRRCPHISLCYGSSYSQCQEVSCSLPLFQSLVRDPIVVEVCPHPLFVCPFLFPYRQWSRTWENPLSWVVLHSLRLSCLPHGYSVETKLYLALFPFVDASAVELQYLPRCVCVYRLVLFRFVYDEGGLGLCGLVHYNQCTWAAGLRIISGLSSRQLTYAMESAF